VKGHKIIGLLTGGILACAALAVVLSLSGYGGPGAPAAVPGGDPAYAGGANKGLVPQVYVTRLPQPDEAGNAEVAFPAAARKIVSGIRQTSAEGPPAGEQATRRLYVAFKELRAEQARYIQESQAAKAVLVFDVDSQKVRPANMKPWTGDPAFPEGEKVPLYPFTGSPRRDGKALKALIERSLMITCPAVVDDPRARAGGVWSFGHLMTQLANETNTGITPDAFVRHWLGHWQKDQTVNDITVSARRGADGQIGINKIILDPWPRNKLGELDLNQAPFRLLAIVCRLDLRDNQVLGAVRVGGGGAGEARLIYCAFDPKDKAPLPFTVTFEYGIKKDNFAGVRDWAGQWHRLARMTPGRPDYNAALEKITNQFVNADAGHGDPESPPNFSALAQLRTNEKALGDPTAGVWEMREFRLDVHNTGQLRQVPVSQTPDSLFIDNKEKISLFGKYLDDNTEAVLKHAHRVPRRLPQPGTPFQGGAASTTANARWEPNKKPKSPRARRLFSLATCSGCHAGETFGAPAPTGDTLTDAGEIPSHFTHIRPRMEGRQANLSPYLTGVAPNGKPFQMFDPSSGKGALAKDEQPFSDLERRANDLQDLIDYGLYYELHRLPRHTVH
jgi:hypothetical protein